jgi:hypothetical protein
VKRKDVFAPYVTPKVVEQLRNNSSIPKLKKFKNDKNFDLINIMNKKESCLRSFSSPFKENTQGVPLGIKIDTNKSTTQLNSKPIIENNLINISRNSKTTIYSPRNTNLIPYWVYNGGGLEHFIIGNIYFSSAML